MNSSKFLKVSSIDPILSHFIFSCNIVTISRRTFKDANALNILDLLEIFTEKEELLEGSSVKNLLNKFKIDKNM